MPGEGRRRLTRMMATAMAIATAVTTVLPVSAISAQAAEASSYNYAVQIYGIGADTLQDGSVGGLTFGAARGESYANKSVSHQPSGYTTAARSKDGVTQYAHRCIHDDSWTQIINNNALNPDIYEQCLEQGCTKAVPLTLTADNASDTDETRVFKRSASTGKGDGVGVLMDELNTKSYYFSLKSGKTLTWANSNARAVLNGAQTESLAVYADTTNYTVSNSVWSALPEELQTAIGAKAVRYATDYTNTAADAIATVYDRLWLFSNVEIYGSAIDSLANYKFTGEGTQYARMQAVTAGQVPTNKIEGLRTYNSSGGRKGSWLRSPYASSGNYRSALSWTAKLDYSSAAGSSVGLAPGFVLDRSKTIETKSVTVNVTWNTIAGSTAPAQASVQLLKDGVAVDTATVTAAGSWSYTFDNLDKNGNYTIGAVNVAGYTAAVTQTANGYQITYTEETTTSASVKVQWTLDDGVSVPDSVQVQLSKNGTVQETVTLTAAGNWSYTWTGLDKTATWTVADVQTPDGFTKKSLTDDGQGNWTIVYDDKTPGITTVPVTVKWNTTDESKIPSSLMIVLQYTDTPASQMSIKTAKASTGWTTSFDVGDGREFAIRAYRVPTGLTEKVTGSVEEGFTLTYSDETITAKDISVNMNWASGVTKPESLQVQLVKNGNDEGEPITLNADNNWEYKWSVTDADATYAVRVLDVPDGYNAAVSGSANNGFTISYSASGEQSKSIDITLDIDLDTIDDSEIPASIAAYLKHNGSTKTYYQTTTKGEKHITHTFKDCEWGGQWTVEPFYVPNGFKAVVTGDAESGFHIRYTNFIEPSVQINWEGDEDRDARPASVEVQLYKNGEAYGDPVTVSSANGWTYTWDKAYLTESYSVKLLDSLSRYKISYGGNQDDGFVITCRIGNGGGKCHHHYVWEIYKKATATTDGIMRYRCEYCGTVEYEVPISAYYVFNKETQEAILQAAPNATVTADTPVFISFHEMVKEALMERPDVTLVVDYRNQGKSYEMTIPAGSGEQLNALFGESQFAGFLYLGGAYATVEK